MALQYPLLFPYAKTGYHEEIPYHNNTGRRQTNRGHYLVDAYTAVEEQRLKWLHHHQNELRIDLYNNVCDAITRGDTSAASIRKRIILPSSHTGSPRYMVQNYQDAMALCREYDNPDLFITITSNPRWPEIVTMLCYIEGLRSPDRSEIVARTPSDIDDLISAEIPSQINDPEGFRVVTEYMLHGPCGGTHMDAPCIIEKQCSKHFPKPYYAETTIDEEGYANYRRRNNGVRFKKKQHSTRQQLCGPVQQISTSKIQCPYKCGVVQYISGNQILIQILEQRAGPRNNSDTRKYDSQRKWTQAITEVTLWASGLQLRELLVTIILFCNIKNYCLAEIQGILNKKGKSLDDYPELAQPDPSMLTHMDNRLIREELNYNIKDMHILHESLFSSLNPEQLAIYHQKKGAFSLMWPWLQWEKIRLSSCNPEKRRVFFFLYGPGGTGKTFLYTAVLAKLRAKRKIVLAVAPSGIASLLLPGGRTAHGRFVIPLELMENSTFGIKQKTYLAALIQEVSLIIWDEAPMTQRFAFEALDKTLPDILGAKDDVNRLKLFGGMPILLGGDFRQILPVILKGKRQEVIHACINRSDLWHHCQLHTLSRIMRVNEYSADGAHDTQKHAFNKWVLDVGEAKVPTRCKDREDEPTWIKIPDEFVVRSEKPPIEAIVDTIFQDFTVRQEDEEYLHERAILTPRNDDATQINKHMFKILEGASMTFKSSDEICKGSTDNIDQHHAYPVEFLNKLNFP
ncbi:uncharacterized protein [Rutidosis leptorrhynchoides]|uniref:uncharacterized protein n=1 Tax=Rutidosis leptorrhynchoides TaxID=125765 RepID=UPI003A99F74C